MPTPAHIRAALALLGWSRASLAHRSCVSQRTLASIEHGWKPKTETMDRIHRTLSAAGILFIKKNGGGIGVRLEK